MTYYEILGVHIGASADAIKRAYRAKAMAAHPDREGGDEEAFKSIEAAYQCLSDPVKRAAYDAGEIQSDKQDDIDAAKLLRTYMTDAIDAGAANVPVAISMRLALGFDDNAIALRQATRKRDRLLKWRGRIKRTDDGENVAEQIVDKKLLDVMREIHMINRAAHVNGLVQVLLSSYLDYGADEEPKATTLFISGAST